MYNGVRQTTKIGSMHPFDDAIKLKPASKRLFRGATSAVYGNKAGPLGDVTTALLLNAALLHPTRLFL
jgi:hypothetical protein